MSDGKEIHIAHAGMYAPDHEQVEVVEQFSPGDIAYLKHNRNGGSSETHGLVTNVDGPHVTIQGSSTTLELIVEDGAVVLEADGERTRWDGKEYEFYRVERYPARIAEDLHLWEVHLCYNEFEESPSDECLFVYAREKDEAVEIAKRRSENSPPKVGPVYDEGQIQVSA